MRLSQLSSSSMSVIFEFVLLATLCMVLYLQLEIPLPRRLRKLILSMFPSLLPVSFLGDGGCASVWTVTKEHHPHYMRALKIADEQRKRSLINDICQYGKIYIARAYFARANRDLGVLKCASDVQIQIPSRRRVFPLPWELAARISKHADALSSPSISSWVIESERIPPVNNNLKNVLRTCLRNEPADMAKRASNKEDFIIKPYLGKREADDEMPFPFVCFRDFPLHRDQMETLGIEMTDIKLYARLMAEVLAIMHWIAQIDAAGVDFFLAPPREGHPHLEVINNNLGTHVMWMTDFDQCDGITMDEDGVDKAVRAFLDNEPYYPCPKAACEELWTEFRKTYLEISGRVKACNDINWLARREVPYLSRMFIDKVEEHFGNEVGLLRDYSSMLEDGEMLSKWRRKIRILETVWEDVEEEQEAEERQEELMTVLEEIPGTTYYTKMHNVWEEGFGLLQAELEEKKNALEKLKREMESDDGWESYLQSPEGNVESFNAELEEPEGTAGWEQGSEELYQQTDQEMEEIW